MDKKIIAITGPSGSGKTTLGYNLKNNYDIMIPMHCTTRSYRSDDIDGFYRYLSHNKYKEFAENGCFFITSGDNSIIDKKYGNYYGVLKSDCNSAFKQSNIIILFVSYKDIEQLIEYKNDYSIDILNLTFYNINENMKYRLVNCSKRNQTLDQIERRVNCALKYENDYGEYVRNNSETLYTDILDEKQTYDEACKILKLGKGEK